MTTYTSQYPPAYSDTYVKATSLQTGEYYAHLSFDPSKSLTGTWAGNEWLSADGATTNQRVHVDLGSGKTIKRVYYENGHAAGAATTTGAKDFTIWGSNEASAFAELTYGVDTNWTQITSSVSALDQHVASDTADPKYFTLTNTTAYRYYAFKFANNYGGPSSIGVRRIELQTENSNNIGKINSVPYTSISKINGIAIASVAKVCGVSV